MIYHVTTKQEWEQAKEKNFYTVPSLQSEGFIHCSEEWQVAGVLERYYTGKKDLVKLVIDAGKLESELKYEWSSSVNEYFPHIYGTINIGAVTEVIEIADGQDS
jgi:uncharacterized protein (DUF952 family)